MPTLATNRQARFNYKILETYEAGIVLAGHEVKSVKNGHISLKGSYVTIKNQEAWLVNAQISPYQPKNMPKDYEPTNSRKLLLHKDEIKALVGKTKQKGLTLVPLRVYTKHSIVKLEFGLGQGKRKTDKRETIKKREAEKRIGRALRQRG
jgi:SsrA-binding protein|tara:strand:+ start:794 stop:1243 length:450 start_codon:yes stop_codon:yes gene_type:complete